MKSDPLPREARNLRMEVSAEGADMDSTLPRRVGDWIVHELRGALPPTIFFFVGFNFIVLTTNLLVAPYAIAVSNFMLATVAALVVGKAVITANAMVVVDAEGLSTEEMASFASWTNLSETAFLLPPTTDAADYRLRIFSLAVEYPFAGHPTLPSLRSGRMIPRMGILRPTGGSKVNWPSFELTDR